MSTFHFTDCSNSFLLIDVSLFFLEMSIHPGADRTPLRRHQCFKKNELQILHQAYIRDSHPSTDVLQHLVLQVKAPIDKVRVSFFFSLVLIEYYHLLAMVQKSTS
jgi:hypothetical protein